MAISSQWRSPASCNECLEKIDRCGFESCGASQPTTAVARRGPRHRDRLGCLWSCRTWPDRGGTAEWADLAMARHLDLYVSYAVVHVSGGHQRARIIAPGQG